MSRIILILSLLLSIPVVAQTDACASMMTALPKIEQYKKYKVMQPLVCSESVAATYYGYGKMDDQEVFGIIITDTKHPANHGRLGDAETKHDMAKTSKDKSALKVSRFALGKKSFVAHDVNTGIRRTYGYCTILKNRYVLEIWLNNPSIITLDEFQDFISEYISKINDSGLPD